MTREEAIQVLKKTIAYESDFAEAKRMAIESLSAEPSGDLISRQDAIEAVCGKCSTETRMECALSGYFCCDRRELEALPSADRPKGEWIVENHEVVCSVCGQNNLETDFCPNCGADMRCRP